MRIKTSSELMASGAKKGRIKSRKAQESAVFEYGAPIRPSGLPRASRNAWNLLADELLGRRVLARSDQQLLLDLIQARADAYAAAGPRREAGRARVKEIEAIFAARTPFEEPHEKVEEKPAALSLEEFLATCARSRETFAARLIYDQTLMLDDGGKAFEWAAEDPSTRAREYAQRVVQGALPACELHKLACARFLDDLANGAERGFFFDIFAARLIVVWFTEFCKRPPFDYQLFVLVNLFGWRLASGLRRFRECWLWIARQNGKSELSALVGLFLLLCDGEKRQQVYSAANTREQAGVIFRAARFAVSESPELKKAIRLYQASLTVEDSDSVFQPLASEIVSLDGKRAGGLLCDELHEWADRELWSKLTCGQVSRAHPLTIAISTAGGVRRGFAFEKYELVKKILHGTIHADDIFCCVWELEESDDHKDEKLWVKANPSLLDTAGLKIEALRHQFVEADVDPSALSAFLRYHCNRWIAFSKITTTFTWQKIGACRGYPDLHNISPRQLHERFLADNYSRGSYGGYDHGEVNDLACFCLLYPNCKLSSGDVLPVKVLLAEFWMPEAVVQQRQKEWGVPVEQWVRDGWVRTCAGDINSSRQITQELLELTQMRHPVNQFPLYNVLSIGYDPWHSRPFMTVFAEDTSIQCVEVKPQPSTFTPIAVAFKSAVLAGQVWHLDNPVTKWMLGNVILEREGRYDAIMPAKPDKFSKIDVVQAALSAWQRMDSEPPVQSPRMWLLEDDGSMKVSGPDGHFINTR